jgi:hypothetical protein
MILSHKDLTGNFVVSVVSDTKPISILNIITYINKLNRVINVINLANNNIDNYQAIQLIEYVLLCQPNLKKIDLRENRIENGNKILVEKIEELVSRENFK